MSDDAGELDAKPSRDESIANCNNVRDGLRNEVLLRLAPIVLSILAGALAGCTAEQRSDCLPCNVLGICRILGDDPNAAMRKHPAWFGLSAVPETRSVSPDE